MTYRPERLEIRQRLPQGRLLLSCWRPSSIEHTTHGRALNTPAFRRACEIWRSESLPVAVRLSFASVLLGSFWRAGFPPDHRLQAAKTLPLRLLRAPVCAPYSMGARIRNNLPGNSNTRLTFWRTLR